MPIITNIIVMIAIISIETSAMASNSYFDSIEDCNKWKTIVVDSLHSQYKDIDKSGKDFLISCSPKAGDKTVIVGTLRLARTATDDDQKKMNIVAVAVKKLTCPTQSSEESAPVTPVNGIERGDP